VIETHCPDGAAPATILGIFGWFAGAGLLMVGGAAIGGGWGLAPLLAWSALFGALGWNFLQYSVAGGSVDPGWLVCGIVFEAMAIGPLLVIVPAVAAAVRSGRPRSRPGSGAYRLARVDGPPVGGAARDEHGAGEDAGVAGTPTVVWDRETPGTHEDADSAAGLVAGLESLAALHASGALTDDEYARAKAAIIGVTEGRLS
jgi:hypothetical protein